MADKEMITKGCRVEVSSDEAGFDGAWYVATVVDVIDKTPTIKKTPNNKKRFNKKTPNTKTGGYVVKYDTLYEEEEEEGGGTDGNLRETVEPRFVRPIPPPMGADVEYKVGDVIDAYHRDGWWIGVIKKVLLIDVEENGGTYLVSFQNPPEEVEFEKHQLRFHVDWVDSCWMPPLKNNNKTQEHVSAADINATHTAESNNEAQSGFTTPSRAARPTVIENPSTGRLPSTKKRSRLRQNTESNSEMINAVEVVSTYNLRKTNSRTVKPVKENSRGDRSQASSGGKIKKTVQVHVMERSGSQAMHQDSPIVKHEAITTETFEAEYGQSQQRTKKGRPLLLEETSKTGNGHMVKSPNDLQEGNQNARNLYWRMMMQYIPGNPNARNMNSSAFNEATSALDHLHLSIWPQGPRPHSVLNRSQAIISNGGTNNEQEVWPFVKKSSCWATIESAELHQKQKPHFSPLKKMIMSRREGYAIGLMVTFGNVIRDVLDYQPSTPIEKINDSLKVLDELEPHGFDVSGVRGRLKTFLNSKVEVGKLKDESKKFERDIEICNDELKKFENDIEICNVEKRAAEEELAKLEEKIRKLQEKMVRNVKTKELKDQDVKKLQSNLDIVANKITEKELAIKKLAAMPL